MGLVVEASAAEYHVEIQGLKLPYVLAIIWSGVWGNRW